MARFINVRLILNKVNGADHRYRAELEHHYKGSPPAVEFDFNDNDLKYYSNCISSYAESEYLKTVGSALYNLIFRGELKGVFETWIGEKKDDQQLLRLRLDIRPPELIGIPWELFFQENNCSYLARRNVSIVRFINNVDKNKVKLVSDLKVLIISAAPNGLNFDENEYIKPLKSLFHEHNIVCDCISGVSYSSLRQKLNDNKYHLFYFVGHGIYKDGIGKIILRESDGQREEVESGDLGTLLSKAGVQLAFFHSCQTAQINSTGAANQINPFLGVAQNLIAAGVPAVVAMQYNFPQGENGKTFVREFYNHLLKHKSIDQAMQEAREAIKSSEYTWCIPVLYLQDDVSNVEDVPIANETNAAREISQPQKIADLLWLLDYSDQEQVFNNAIKDCKEGAFLVRTDEEKIQRWLVGRLARCVSDFEKAKKYQIRIRTHIRSDFDAFWQEFKQDIRNEINRETVIQGLAELCQQKSVIIAIYGLSSLEREKLIQFYDFWIDLVNKVRSGQRFFRSHLVLLIAEKKTNSVLNELYPPVIKEHQSSIVHLTPLENILSKDVTLWLGQKSVYDSLNLADYQMQSLVDKDIPNWPPKPSEMLDEICYTLFKIDNGIAAIEPYWKLTG